MTTTTYHVHCNGASIKVSHVGRIELADNGQRGDTNQLILLVIGADLTPYLLLTSNADDTAIGWLDDDGEVELSSDIMREWFDTFDLRDDQEPRDWLGDLVGDLADGRIVVA